MFSLLIGILLTGCTGDSTAYNLSYQSKKYLEEVLALLKKESINRNKIDWNHFNNDVFRFAQNSRTIKDTYPAVSYAIKKLQDNHSYFAPAASESESVDEMPLPILKNEETPSDIGYVRIPFCIGGKEQAEIYIQSIADRILPQNNPGIKGWIIDLRDNFGGNMWPMMAAIGSALHPGTQGYFFDSYNKVSEWSYDHGKVYSDTSILAENKNIVSLFGKNKIAILINGKTASSGEAMAVLFKGYAHAKLFGEPTYGVSTGCVSFTLSDGSRINLATSVFADKNKKKYGGVIIPDIPCPESEALLSAIEWIYK